MFQRGYYRLEKDLSDFDVLKSVKKFKASLSYLITKNQETDDIKKRFV